MFEDGGEFSAVEPSAEIDTDVVFQIDASEGEDVIFDQSGEFSAAVVGDAIDGACRSVSGSGGFDFADEAGFFEAAEGVVERAELNVSPHTHQAGDGFLQFIAVVVAFLQKTEYGELNGQGAALFWVNIEDGQYGQSGHNGHIFQFCGDEF